eukprot:6303968-Ditylum_brightwellii.AAC.1
MGQPFRTILSSPKVSFPQWIESSLMCMGTQYTTLMAHTFATEFRMMLNGKGRNPGGHGIKEVECRALHCFCCCHTPTKEGGLHLQGYVQTDGTQDQPVGEGGLCSTGGRHC